MLENLIQLRSNYITGWMIQSLLNLNRASTWVPVANERVFSWAVVCCSMITFQEFHISWHFNCRDIITVWWIPTPGNFLWTRWDDDLSLWRVNEELKNFVVSGLYQKYLFFFCLLTTSHVYKPFHILTRPRAFRKLQLHLLQRQNC